MASINEKLNYINETKSLIKDKLNNLGSEIEDETTFREYAEKIEDLYDEWPKISDEDTTITLNNTKKGKMNLQLKGNTNQFTTTGDQLIDFTTLSNSNTTNSFVNDILTVNTSSGTYANAFKDITSLYKNNTGKILRFDFTSLNSTTDLSGATGYVRLRIVKTDSSVVNVNLVDTSKNIINHTIPSDVSDISSVSLTIYANNTATTITNTLTINKPILHFGGTEKSYEPYTGRIASPNPDYPQDIQIVTGENTITISNEDNTQSQTFNIDLGNLEVCKITDNYQDYFYKENNKWYLYKTIISETINSATSGNISSYDPSASGKTEKWNYSYRTEHPNSNLLKTTVNGYHYVYANKFTVVVQTSEWNIDTGICLSAYGHNDWFELRFRVPTTYTKEQAINFINGTKVCYPMVPSNIEITDATLITQLNSLEQAMTYDEQTNISQTNGTLPFIISASALLKNSN